MADLFARPAKWRAPSRPREEACRGCGAAAPCGMDGAFYCLACVPPGFWPAKADPAPAEDPGLVL